MAAVGFARGRLSSKWRSLQEAPARHEDAWEICYRAQGARWLGVQPLFQYIRHPGGDTRMPPVRLIGLRLEATL